MSPTKPVTVLSNQPDVRLLMRLARVHRCCLGVVAVIAATILGGWLVPAITAWLPRGWSVMTPGTALALLLAAANLALTDIRPGPGQRLLAIACAIGVVTIAGAALLVHYSAHPIEPGTWVGGAHTPDLAGSMTLQTAFYLLILGLTLAFIRVRKKPGGAIIDCLAVSLMLMVLIVSAGYCFHAEHFFGQSSVIRTSVQTFACMVLLAFVVIGRRAEHGYFAVLIGVGIGSQVARIVLPIALVLPFLLMVGGAYTRIAGWLTAPYTDAITAATMAFIFCSLLVAMAWRINALERDLRDMSVTDALTGCYNRHGFGVLSAQALREAQRTGSSLTALFFDVDDLKAVNDRLGHDAGSRILMDVGRLLRRTFRGADIVARVGGDEFAVVMHGDENAADTALTRLEDKTRIKNKDGRRPYTIGYSVGMATARGAELDTLDTLITRADANMYEQKRTRKIGRDRLPVESQDSPASILADGK